ncbi:class I SAM-dependent methyltransferase [Haloechinothrix salitolerans]|uniref:Class I SAM-dependent methyltransferase n=1 Tax=Haloechinothrix salitolerans TaxID=926830 RepID=A0ABW2BUT5_9PSEU
MRDAAWLAPEKRHIDAWVEWQEAPWGRLRYRLVSHTLSYALRGLGARCRVLDIGGGDGADSVPLAAHGHDVTVLDKSEELLARAAERTGGRLAGRVRTVRADLDELAGREPLVAMRDVGAGYDLVLCHNVLQYRPDLAGTVNTVVRAARPGGVVSLLSPNPAMDVLTTAVRRCDPANAADLLDAETVRSVTFERDMLRVDADDVARALAASACVVTHRFGIRCVTDLIADDERKRDPAFFAELERLELALCEREPFVRMARYWQLLAVRGKGDDPVRNAERER